MGHGNEWKARFPNKHTRPDRDDPRVAKTRADFKAVLGKDALEEAVDFSAYLEELRAKHCSPEYQEAAQAGRDETEAFNARQLVEAAQRHIENLSPRHVSAVRAGCDANLTPITTTPLLLEVIAKWDGVESMFLLGGTGVGKTYTATWCAMRAIAKGRDAASITALRVVAESPEKINVLRSVDVLVIDQLHTLESPLGGAIPAWQVGPVIDLIDYRYEQELTTIAAGTISVPNMVKLLGADVKRRFPVRLASESTDIRRERQ